MVIVGGRGLVSHEAKIGRLRVGFCYARAMSSSPHRRSIIILDLGGQYAHLIASRIRRFGFTSFILPADTKAELLKDAAGIILSGGPQSVYEKGSPAADPGIFSLGIPVLGLCYGHQWMAQALGGTVSPAVVKEYGPTDIKKVKNEQRRVNSNLLADLPEGFRVWMSHGDEVTKLPSGFVTVASSKDCIHAAMMNAERKLFGIQFHIEVTHTQYGMEILRNFVDLCQPEPWSVTGYAAKISEEVKREVGDQPSSSGLRPAGRKVFMLVSGGVDSTVAFTLLNKVLGAERVTGLLVDTGLMRKGEITAIQKAFEPLGIHNLHIEEASERFYAALEGVYEPEKKREIIGNTFLAVQKEVSDRMGLKIEEGWMLGQGTIYPDTIETGGTKHADKIKTHHNRVELIQKMMEQGLVVEPLKELYKDEVRQLGEELGLPHDLVWRQPFPGPGLGVRILCAQEPSLPKDGGMSSGKRGSTDPQIAEMVLPVLSVGVQGDGRTYRHALALFADDKTPTDTHYGLATSIPNGSRVFSRVLLCTSHAKPFDPVFTPTMIEQKTADLLRDADSIVDAEVRKAELYDKIWQFPVVLLPFGSQAGGRSIVLRPIESTDAMTAAAYRLPHAFLRQVTEKILQIDGIDAVFLDLTNKPPGTIEWE